jgi:Bacterial Ig-like domain
MHRRTISVVAGALVAASLLAPVAQAAEPAEVTVRVEAPARTLVSTTLTTTTAKVVKDGNPAHACPGTSAAGALDQATGGDWSGTWFDGLGYAVDAIGGVSAPADFSSYWTLWVNGRSSTTGICGTELETGDEVLEFLCTTTADFSSCENLPLALRVVNVRGGQAAVKVVLLKGDGTSTPVAGATVSGGVQPVTTLAGGSARVALRSGASTLRATHAGDVPSARLHCEHGAHGGRCGSRDRTAPTLKLKGVASGLTFAAADAPRVLRGVARDAGGLADVSLRLTRRAGGDCTAFDGERGRFVACNGRRAPRVEVGDRTRWSYLLPARLATGGYRLVVVATDKAGNRTRVAVRFEVEA